MDHGPAALGSISLLDLTLETVEENLALDEALLIEADEGRAGAVLRFWESPRFAVVLGASRRMSEDVRRRSLPGRRGADPPPFQRRRNGGHRPGALNVTLVLPDSAAPGLAAVDVAQRFVLERIAAALSTADRPVDPPGLGRPDHRRPEVRRHRPAQAEALVPCPLLHPLRFPARSDQPLPDASRAPARLSGGRSHDDFLRNLDLPRRIILDLIRSAWSPSRSLSRRRMFPTSSSKPCSPNGSPADPGSSDCDGREHRARRGCWRCAYSSMSEPLDAIASPPCKGGVGGVAGHDQRLIGPFGSGSSRS